MKNYVILILSFFSIISYAQQTEAVDFISIDADVRFDTKTSSVFGQSRYIYNVLKPIDSISIDAKNMEILEVFNEHSKIDFTYNNKTIVFKSTYKLGETQELNIRYKAQPKKALYFIDWNKDETHPEFNPQIWTQGQGKYTSNWLPSIDDMNDKIIFDLSISFKNGFEVIANGKLESKTVGETQTKWHYTMQKPMSSYLLALVIGKYNKSEELSNSGVPLEYYYYPKDSLKIESTYRYSKQMFDFLEEEIGINYPWQNYKQVPVKDFLYSGMENTSCTIFSDAFMVDSTEFNDNNYVNVNAHELAHQWFGDLITETSGTHHWLQEGFATYYALLAEKNVFGEDYYYYKLFEYYQELEAQDQASLSTALLNPKSSSTTFYKKGAWALHVLRDKVGDKVFKLAVASYLDKYKFKNVETKNFIDEVEQISGQELQGFVKKWLESSELPKDDMEAFLNTNENTSFLITQLETPYLSYRTDNSNNAIPSSVTYTLPKGYYSIQLAILKEALSKPDYPGYNSILEDAFKSTNLLVRQTLVFQIENIPLKHKEDFEDLLNDKSYLTQEAALFKLWVNFPEYRAQYLNKMQSVIGDNGRNVRLLWIVLAINTKDYQNNKKQDLFNELVNYTHSVYSFNIRQNAFIYLRDLEALNQEVIKNLNEAATHHNWRFSSFAKKLLEQLK